MISDAWSQMIACSKFRPHADGGGNQSFNASAMFHADLQRAGNCLHASGAREPIETGNHGARL
jgi:hypothetical protein